MISHFPVFLLIDSVKLFYTVSTYQLNSYFFDMYSNSLLLNKFLHKTTRSDLVIKSLNNLHILDSNFVASNILKINLYISFKAMLNFLKSQVKF